MEKPEYILQLENDVFKPLEDVIGKDKIWVETHFEGPSLHEYNLFLWFKGATITNEEGETHLIRDMFAKVVIAVKRDHKGILLNVNKIRFQRLTVSTKEFKHKYSHSHLSANPFDGQWNIPCLGEGPLSRMVNLDFILGFFKYETKEDGELSDSYSIETIDFKDNIFTYFISLIKEIENWVQTESISGGPYIRMNSLSSLNVAFDWKNIKNNVVPPNKILEEYLILAISNTIANKNCVENCKVYFSIGIEELLKKIYSAFYDYIKYYKNDILASIIQLHYKNNKKYIKNGKVQQDKLPIKIWEEYNSLLSSTLKDSINIYNDVIYTSEININNIPNFSIKWRDQTIKFKIVRDKNEKEYNCYSLEWVIVYLLKELMQKSKFKYEQSRYPF